MAENDSLLILKALKEDGIEHVYVQGLAHFPKEKVTDSLSGQKERSRNAKIAHLVSKGTGTPPKTGRQSPESEIAELRDKILRCKLCGELAKTRNKVVFGAGNIRAKLVFVGEAPGADEDAQGLPFVGRAGKLLTKIIEAMGFSREQVFICNVLKCRPPHNRPPAPGEVAHCRPFLKRQLELIKPKVIVALGNHAAQALLQTEKGISELRGTFQEYEGIPVMCTYHPAYLLRSPGEKGKVWEDMKKVIQRLNTDYD